MRLLRRDDIGKFRLTQELLGQEIPPYAIFSHTWGAPEEEVSFDDLVNGVGKDKPGYMKIKLCGEQAAQDGLQYFWMDVCCINKANRAEFSYAINSMFRWYRNAARCYVYLSDVFATEISNQSLTWDPDLQRSRWFTRAWTLQELLAPDSVEFYSREWLRLGDKESLAQQIHQVTGVPTSALQGAPLSRFTTNERLSWMQHRQATFEEDKIYGLLGIFDVYIPPIYGEGIARAFKRLTVEIDKLEKCMQDLRLSDPRDDKKRIEEPKGSLLEGSCCWIFENTNFQRWYNDSQSRLLLLKDGPGKGKTTLVCGIIDELEQRIAKTNSLSYFFCQATDSRINNATAVLRGLTYLLVSQQPSLVSHIRKKHDHAGKALFNDANTWIALSEIFNNILQDPSLNFTYLIIDALDECIVGLPRLLDFIEKSPATTPMLSGDYNWKNLGATLSLDPEEDDADIKTFVDSGYGATSETSSFYSIANAPGAREDVLSLLLQDERLRILFSSAFEKVSATKFEISFRIMLGQFARELRNEAQNRCERSAAYVVRTMAGYVANSICKKYRPIKDERSKEMDELSKQLPHKRQLLEKFLNPALTHTDDSYNEGNSAEGHNHEAEDDDWDEPDMVSLPHLEQLEKFMVNSQAMSNLRNNLQDWIDPQQQHPHSLVWGEVTAEELLETQKPNEQELVVEHYKPDTHDRSQPPWRLKRILKRFVRPPVPLGYRRLEWTCDCGEEMYGDYDNKNPIAVEKLASILQRRTGDARVIETDIIIPRTDREQDTLGYKHTSGDSGGRGDSSAHGSAPLGSIVLEQSSSKQAAASDQADSAETKDPSSDMQTSSQPSSGNTLHDTARKSTFFELCVNTGEIDISLGEIDISDVNSDGELFKRIYERYKDLRGHRMRRIFLKPVDVHFVHFSVQGRYRVGIYGQPLVIPPETEVKAKRYHYEECPLDVQPPMDYRTFLHYMKKHKHGDPANPAGICLHTDTIFLNRLPKKTGNSIFASQQPALQFGWGVHIIEGPNKVALSWITFLCLALSFVVSVIYCHFWHTQEQGFGIGQWLVAVLSAAITALYFQWAET